MEKTYRLKVAGLERELPICPLNKKMSIAAFIMFSDVELTVACAKELLTRVPDFDVIVTAESKGIPLAYEMARQSGKNSVSYTHLDVYKRQPSWSSCLHPPASA